MSDKFDRIEWDTTGLIYQGDHFQGQQEPEQEIPGITEYLVVCDIAKAPDADIIQVYHITPKLIPGSRATGRPDKIVRYADLVYVRKTVTQDYADFVRSVCLVCATPAILGNYTLIVDGTGVGSPVVSMMRESGLAPIPIIFTSGAGWHEEYEKISTMSGQSTFRMFQKLMVSKEEMTQSAIVIMQQGRLRISADLPQMLKDDIRKQLIKFTGKVNERTKKVAYENLTDQDHDDQVVCILMAAFWMVQYVPKLGEVKDHVIQETPDKTTMKAGCLNPHDYV